MTKHDEIRLRHMIEAAREAVSFARGRVRSDLDIDRQLVLLNRCVYADSLESCHQRVSSSLSTHQH